MSSYVDSPVIFMMSHHYLVFPLAVLLFAAFCCSRLSKKKSTSDIKAAISDDVKSSRSSSTACKPTQWYRNLFFQLQNVEDHPNVLELARRELLVMFSRGISLALEQPKGSILNLEHYDAKRVWDFINNEHEEVLTEWKGYLKRREEGQGPELFATAEAAKAWLVQHAPVKFVDGAWLGHTHKVTTPFALRTVTKDAWQVLSEELGDGDLAKHHVSLYRQLLQDVGCPLPDGHTVDFIKSSHWDGVDNHGAWKAAVGQLLISLFPNEFLPEILGFNMHYELVTLDTMRANHELKALGINPYYFLIHIAIDNADSGHTAMATHTVTRYLDTVRATEGEEALKQAWKRVQVGYTLSQTLGSQEQDGSNSGVTETRSTIPDIPLNSLSARVIDIFKAKASVSHQFHCQCRAKIGGQTVAEWLAPSMWMHPHQEQHLKLLTALSRAKPWVYPGESNKSLLVRELQWKGRMFGAFTHDEVVTLAAWIDSLGSESDSWLYWNFTSRTPQASKDVIGELRDPARHYPVVIPHDAVEMDKRFQGPEADDSDLEMGQQSLARPTSARLPDVVALWFAHIGLLENCINTPSRTASPLYASILRLLRAQAGFASETHIVAGMDEMKRPFCPSLVGIGQELIARAGWTTAASAEPGCLHDVLLLAASQGQREESAKLARDMLRWGARPSANLGLLLGLALAFLELKEVVAGAPGLLSGESQCVLRAIVARERQSLEECTRELRDVEGAQYKQLIRGYKFGQVALGNCLQ
ncbi:MAG: hypothetical protein M1822_007411 [Bathelium mastoideum]|nr:MAG: hypothetical protein M1822_007411 [Bathelium mastoideum]